MAEQGDAIETLFVDLALRTEKLERDLEAALSKSAKKIKDGLGEPVEDSKKKIISMGEVFKSVLQSMFTTLVQTKNPFAALTTGVQGANVAIQAAAASGSEAATSLVGLASSAAGVVTALVAVAAAAKPVLDFIMQMAARGKEASARFDSLSIGLGIISKNAGVSLDFVNEKVQKLKETGITTLESMESIIQFLSQKLPIDNIEGLARAGQNMAVAFGRNSTETFNRFVYAIMTGNNEVLRMVGINKTASQMQEEFAKKVGKTVKELTDLERKQAIVDGIIKASTGYAGLYEKSLDTVGKKISSLQRITEEAALAFGQTFLPVQAGLIDITTQAIQSFQGLFVEIEHGATVTENGVPKYTKLGQTILSLANDIKDLLEWIKELIEQSSKLLDQVMKLSGEKSAGGFAALVKIIELYTKFVKGNIETVGLLISKIPFLSEAFNALGAVMKVVTDAGETFWLVLKMGVSGFGAALSIATDLVENIGRLMKGETLRTMDEILGRAKKVGDDLLLLQMGILPDEQKPDDVKKDDEPLIPPETEKDTSLEELLSKMALAAADIIEAGNEQIEKAKKDFKDKMAAFNQEVIKAQKDLRESLDKAVNNILEAANKQKIKFEKDYNDSLKSLSKDAAKAKQEETARAQEEERKQKEDFLRSMQRMEEDYLMSLQDAVQERDAKKVLQLMRQHTIEQKRANEDADLGRKKREEDHKNRLTDIDKQEEEKRQALKDKLDEQLADLAENTQEKIKELQDNYREQMRLLIDNAEKQRVQMRKDLDKQLNELKLANAKRLSDLVKNWADQKSVNETGARQVLTALNKIYGLGGDVDRLMNDYKSRMTRNDKVTITVARVIEQGDTMTESTPLSSSPSNRAPIAQRGDLIRRAKGGLDFASSPTGMVFGDAGPEYALTLPANSSMSLEKLFSSLGGAGKSNHASMDLRIRVDTDGSVSPMFEDKIIESITAAFKEAIPTTKVRT